MESELIDDQAKEPTTIDQTISTSYVDTATASQRPDAVPTSTISTPTTDSKQDTDTSPTTHTTKDSSVASIPSKDTTTTVDQKDKIAAPSTILAAPAATQSTSSTPILTPQNRSATPKLTLPEKVGAIAPSGKPVILGIAVVDFNHLVGPQVEYAHPKELAEDEELCANLPFMALPDGSHLSDEDFCYFHLTCPKLSPSTIFGISCNRQIASDALLVKGAEVTRSTVQKAIVVLAREPVFGPIREKLGVVTRAFFTQGDLGDVNILIDFHATLEQSLKNGGFSEDSEAVLYMGTSLRELIYKWRYKTLVLLKLLLLQRKIMFYGYPVERLCTYQYSLVSLIPGLLLALQDSGDPNLDTHTSIRRKAESLKTSDRKSLIQFMGLPLHLFGQDSFFQPYLPLQQIDMLQAHSWLVGTTNAIFKQQKDCQIDVIVDLEQGTLEFLDQRLTHIASLTAADRKWMDEMVNVVTDGWNANDPSRPASMQFVGSDDFLRFKYEEYICSLLSAIKYSDFLAKSEKEKESPSISAPDVSTSQQATQAYGNEFISHFKQTRAFELWNTTTDPMLFDIVEHKHPCDGKTSSLEDVAIRLSSGLHDLHLEENLGPTREAIGNAIQAGGANVWKFAGRLGQDLNKLKQQASDAAAARRSANANNVSTPTATTPSTSQPVSYFPPEASAAAAQASSQVKAAFGSFGSFLAKKQTEWRAASASGAGSKANSAHSSVASTPALEVSPKPSTVPLPSNTTATTALSSDHYPPASSS